MSEEVKVIEIPADDKRVGKRKPDGTLVFRPRVDIEGQPYTPGQRPVYQQDGYFVVLPPTGLPPNTEVKVVETAPLATPKADVKPVKGPVTGDSTH